MLRFLACVLLLLLGSGTASFAASCAIFTGSTMDVGGFPKAQWRTDYPAVAGTPTMPWKGIDFRIEPARYMEAVLSTARSSFSRSGTALVGTGTEEWWASLWLDYTTNGREPLMGLTKERGPDPGDLSPTSSGGFQVWAVGFYNTPGATVLGQVFLDPCVPSLTQSLNFPEGTVSVKFLFTDADPAEVVYLDGAPSYEAIIDAAGTGGMNPPPPVESRQKRTVRLLQVDISVKDADAAATGWIFGTFGWVGPTTGDGLFDNLTPVSLQWGNDPEIYDQAITQSWINPGLQMKMYGWDKRPTLGFNGRANGPADNIRSSCLSCHAAARTPRSSLGIVGFTFDMANIGDPAKVKQHVDVWFDNIKSGSLFRPDEPAVSALDYSLQVEAAIYRMCRACRLGDLPGDTPPVCMAARFYTPPQCSPGIMPLDAAGNVLREQMLADPPPRQ